MFVVIHVIRTSSIYGIPCMWGQTTHTHRGAHYINTARFKTHCIKKQVLYVFVWFYYQIRCDFNDTKFVSETFKMLGGKNVLITGASRGLGLEMVKQLMRSPINHKVASQSPALIIATCRNPDKAPELQKLAEDDHNRLYIKKLDVTNFDSYLGFMKEELEVK